MIVSNSTVLIYLGKINKIDLLKTFYKKIAIPKAVFEEVVIRGKEGNYADAIIVENAVKEGWIVVKNCRVNQMLTEFGIDRGEAEAISLAAELHCQVLLDQTHARIAAKTLGLSPRGTLFILLKALNKKLVDFDAFIDLLEELISVGFRMEEEVYLEAVKKARQIQANKK